MMQSFYISDQGPSHSGVPIKRSKPHTLIHFKDPNFHRENSSASLLNVHNKRRTDCTVYEQDFLSKWNIKTHLYKPVLQKQN